MLPAMLEQVDVIQRAGGDAKVAKACGVSLDALRKWREIGRVPSKHWPLLSKLARVPLAEIAEARLERLMVRSIAVSRRRPDTRSAA